MPNQEHGPGNQTVIIKDIFQCIFISVPSSTNHSYQQQLCLHIEVVKTHGPCLILTS